MTIFPLCAQMPRHPAIQHAQKAIHAISTWHMPCTSSKTQTHTSQVTSVRAARRQPLCRGAPDAASGSTCAKSESPTSVRPSHAVTSTSWQAATGMAISQAPAARASAVLRSAAACGARWSGNAQGDVTQPCVQGTLRADQDCQHTLAAIANDSPVQHHRHWPLSQDHYQIHCTWACVHT